MAQFTGSVPELYDRHLVPLLFEEHADYLAERVVDLAPANVLEVAAGTGVVTRALSARLGAKSRIVATDLSQEMLDRASRTGVVGPVEWSQADVMNLPFDDGAFDVVACQFSAMFFPDKPGAFSEVRRVLHTDSHFLFSTWGCIEDNEFADVVTEAVARLFPDDPPDFLRRVPHGYHDPDTVRSDLKRAGFAEVELEERETRTTCEDASAPAIAFCQGTPLRQEICARDASRLDEVTDAATKALANRFGETNLDGKAVAYFVSARR